MSKISSFSAAILITIFVAAGTKSVKAIGQNPVDKPVSTTIQEDIYKIFQTSCIDCHAKGGKKMAMSHVNFSD